MENTPTALPVTIASGEKAKARDILAAIRTVKQIEAEHRQATPDEKRTLGLFAGFGPVALSIFPDPVTGKYKDASWQAIGEELKSALTPEEYTSARATVFNAFYTSPTVIKAMHQAITRLGLPANATILEPGCGIGNFMSYGQAGTRFIGVEMDSISGRIARALHPEADIRIENFRDTRLAEGRIDAVIGNPPFADVKLDFHGMRLPLHDYFIAKSLGALKPGGILAVVTSHYTLDKQNAGIREQLAAQADFVGAIRLPSDAFKRQGTAVVTDIVFLRKRVPGEPAQHADPEWLTVAPLPIEGAPVPVNRYFLGHPEMVLGDWSRKDTLYGGEGYSVTANGDLAQQLQAAIHKLPEFSRLAESPNDEEPSLRRSPGEGGFTPPPLQRHIGEGSFFVSDGGTICQMTDGQAQPVVYGGKTLATNGTMTAKRLAALIGLRDVARRVLQSQNEGWPEAARNEARRELNWAYDRFTNAYGPINKTTFSETEAGSVIRRMPNLAKFREDPDAMLVMSLEDYDEVTGIAAKAAIMQKDVVGKNPPITKVASAEEGLLVSLNQRGKVDLPFIGELYGKTKSEIVSELGNLIFPNPEAKAWETADAYLSGNVRAKLAAAEAAGPPFARNVEALRNVQPEDVLPGDIDANLGAPWIPESDIQAFACHLFNVEPSSIQVAHLKKDAVWSIDADSAAHQSVAATSEYGTARQRRLAARPGAQHEDAGDLRHHQPRRRRGARGQSRGDAGRPREAKTHQGEIPRVAVHRSRKDGAVGPTLQRHLQQFAAAAVRWLASRLPRHEPDDHPQPAPERRRLALHEFGQHAARPRRRRRQDVYDGSRRHENEAGRHRQEADVCRAQPFAGAVRPRIHATLSQRQAAGRRQGGFHARAPQDAHRQDRQRRLGWYRRHAFVV